MRALRTIKANGEWYEPGDALPALPEADRKRLLEAGAVAEDDAEATTPEGEATKGPAVEADLLEAARALAGEYAEGAHDPDQWTGAGVPGTALLGERVGRKVTAAERDAAWAAVQEG